MATWPLRVRPLPQLLLRAANSAGRHPAAPLVAELTTLSRWHGLRRNNSSIITCASLSSRGFNAGRPLTTARGSATHDPASRSTSGEDGRGDIFIPIYRFPAIRATRFISRLKNVQTIFMVVALPPIYYLHTQGLVDEHSLRLTSGVAALACCSLYGISHYLRRWVGLMALSADGSTLRVSHLSFWGGRRDRFVPVADVVPLSEGRDRPQDPLLALRCYSHRDVLYFSLRYGRVLDGVKFRAVFGDTFVSPDR
ncbi:transmembrane protein 186-like isoform X1 [Lethenteron reissneri]|uniref:transmembrane protein 186-like isoform X1 n=1 Tax=Lethenteron reissneri TaxID=7753 RepID=UPI002AB78707|nr:transmembrane protein 186-like isoform X1 [Lethenteron reissneri]